MPNAKDAETKSFQRILLVGDTGSGKTTQIATLPGKKFVYIFDPNALESLRGFDVDYEEFLVDELELDATIKGFNKNARPDDRSPSNVEPQQYMRFINDFNDKSKEGFFNDYDWIIFDSLTFLQKILMDRQMWINKRYGGVEELADYRVVGSKESDVFRSITSMKINIFCTGHLRTWQDEITKKVSTELNLMGSAKTIMPLMYTNIWLAQCMTEGDKQKYIIRTVPDRRGLQNIRSSLRGLKPEEDVTIADFSKPEQFGIGKLLKTKGE